MTSSRNEVAPNVAGSNTQKENQKKHYRFQRPLPCAAPVRLSRHTVGRELSAIKNILWRSALSRAWKSRRWVWVSDG